MFLGPALPRSSGSGLLRIAVVLEMAIVAAGKDAAGGGSCRRAGRRPAAGLAYVSLEEGRGVLNTQAGRHGELGRQEAAGYPNFIKARKIAGRWSRIAGAARRAGRRRFSGLTSHWQGVGRTLVRQARPKARLSGETKPNFTSNLQFLLNSHRR